MLCFSTHCAGVFLYTQVWNSNDTTNVHIQNDCELSIVVIFPERRVQIKHHQFHSIPSRRSVKIKIKQSVSGIGVILISWLHNSSRLFSIAGECKDVVGNKADEDVCSVSNRCRIMLMQTKICYAGRKLHRIKIA